MTTNSQLSTTEPKKTPKQTTQTPRTETDSQNRDHMEGYQWGGGGGKMGEKVQEIRSINSRYTLGGS